MSHDKTVNEPGIAYTVPSASTIIEPFIQRGLFENPEKAVSEMARFYILRQIEWQQTTIEHLQKKYGMNYDQFNAYLQERANTLTATPDPVLNQAIMLEEEDALDWKAAREMLSNWLGLKAETNL